MTDLYSDGVSKVSSLRVRLKRIGVFSSHDEIETSIIEAIDLLSKGKGEIIDQTIDSLGETEGSSTDFQNDLSICKQEKLILNKKVDKLNAQILSYQDSKIIAKKLAGKKIGIIGGHRKDIEKVESGLKSIEQTITFKTTEAEKNKGTPPSKDFDQKYSSVDVILVFTDYSGHSLTRAAEKVAKKYNIKIINENRHDSINAIVKKILD